MPKALLTATVQSHIAQFHEPAIRLLKEHGYEVHVAARDNLAQKIGLTLSSPDRVFDVPFERSPVSPRNLAAARQLSGIMRETQYDIIHCNTPVAGVLTRLFGQRARAGGAKLVYTAHGFHFFKGAPPQNWLLYYPLERFLARFTDVLVTINTEDYARARSFPARSVRYVPGVGVDLEKFADASVPASITRTSLGLRDDDFVVLSVGELNDNKNHRTVIRALAELNDARMHYLICGNGPRRQQLEKLARDAGVGERVHFLGYRRDIPQVLAAADVFCLPSFREGLPLSVMEAMAASKPVVCTGIRGNVDLVEPGRGGFLIDPPDDVAGYATALDALSANPREREEMGAHNRLAVRRCSDAAIAEDLRQAYGLHSGLRHSGDDAQTDGVRSIS